MIPFRTKPLIRWALHWGEAVALSVAIGALLVVLWLLGGGRP